jgi:hypothetical protein
VGNPQRRKPCCSGELHDIDVCRIDIGRYEAVFFPETYRRTARTLFKAKGPFIIRGRVESDLGAINLTTENVILIDKQSL